MWLDFLVFAFILAPILIAGKYIFKHEYSWEELGIQLAASLLVILVILIIGYSSASSDYKIVNGVVESKKIQKEQCDNYHFWSDWPDSFCTNEYTRSVKSGTQTCTTNSNNQRTCVDNYKTQYKSVYPWEQKFYVNSTIENYQISREDRQGAITPKRYTIVNIGDPVSGYVEYTNYIKGASSTLFNQKFEEQLQIEYPEVYDYYRVNRVLTHNYTYNSTQLNELLSKVNSSLKEGNVILVLTSEQEIFAEKLAQAWDAHNINDIVITIGLEGQNIEWVNVKSWAKEELVNVVLRDKILELKTLQEESLINAIFASVDLMYEPKTMEEFEYLADDVKVPNWVYVLYGLLMLVITPVSMWFLSTNKHRDQ